MGCSRQQFYEIRRNYQTYGADGLIDRLPGPRGPLTQCPACGGRLQIVASLIDPVSTVRILSGRGPTSRSEGPKALAVEPHSSLQSARMPAASSPLAHVRFAGCATAGAWLVPNTVACRVAQSQPEATAECVDPSGRAMPLTPPSTKMVSARAVG